MLLFKPWESDLIEDGSNNFRLYLKICRSLLDFTTLGYTLRSVKPQESDLIEDVLHSAITKSTT